jgi:hypothetical protein
MLDPMMRTATMAGREEAHIVDRKKRKERARKALFKASA